MKKQLFLKQLESHLQPLGQNDVSDILRDQEEFINEAMSAGRREEDVVASLGDPKKFAQNIIAESRLTNAEQATTFKKQISTTWSVLKSFAVLAPLNIFVLLGPFFVLVLLIACGWLMSFGLIAGGISMVGVFFAHLKSLPVETSAHVAYIAFAMGMAGVGELLCILMYYVSRIFLWGTVGYVRWNYNFLNQNINKV